MNSPLAFSKKWKSAAVVVLLCIAGIGFIKLFHQLISVHHPIVETGSVVRIIDGVYYLAITDAFWTGDSHRMYDLKTQIDVVRKLTNAPVKTAMPLNPLPTLFAVQLPFTAYASGDMRLAYSAWMGLSLYILICAILWFSFKANPMQDRAFLLGMISILIGLYSYSTLVGVILGQTSVLHTACLLLMITPSERESSTAVGIKDATCIFVLSIKPQFFLLGLALCFINRRFKGLLYGIGLTGVVILCITPLLGYDWPLQYLKTLKFYQGAKIDPAYQGVFWPELMNIFAPAFSDWIGSSAAMLLTWLFMGAGCVLALVLSRIDPETKRYQVPATVLLLSSYLLFSPHSGFYEEILWIAVAAAVVSIATIRTRTILQITAACGAALLVNRLLFDDILYDPKLWWFIKLLVYSLLFAGSFSAARLAAGVLNCKGAAQTESS